MANDDRIGARHFFGPGTFGGLGIGLICALFTLIIHHEINPVSRNQKATEFKKYLFHAVVLKLGELNEEPDGKNVNFAIATANFLKNELGKGNTIEAIVSEEKKLSAIYDISDEDEREKVASLFLPQTLPHIILLAQNREWKRFRDNPENIKILKELLAGNGKIPEIVYPNDSSRLIFWIAIFLIQFFTFVGYVIRVNERRSCDYGFPKFYQLQWNKVYTYIVILLLSPGMWIVVIPWLFLSLIWFAYSFDPVEFLIKRQEVGLAKKDEARKALENRFDANSIRGKFSQHRKDGQILLEKLESQLQKEGEAL